MLSEKNVPSVISKTNKQLIFMMLISAALYLLFQPTSMQAETAKLTPSTAAEITDTAELEAFLDAYLAEQMETHHIPGAVITFVKDGERLFSKGYGYADLENQTPFDPAQTVLTTASLGKAFTAVAVLQLAEQGLIDLQEDVRPYIRDFDLPDDFAAPLTFAHLLTHTDGFEARVIGGAALVEEDLRPLAEMLADHIPAQQYPPGQFTTYGNFAANLAGYLVEEISGLSFEQYVAKNILSPLGMHDSTFDQRLSPTMLTRLAEGYEYENGEQVQIPFLYIKFIPEGGLRTTAADMNRFMLALLNGGEYEGVQLLDEATVKMMFAQQFTPDPKMPGITYGLFEHFENGQRALLRDGDGIGTRTRMVLLPEHNMGFFVSYNSGDSNLRLDIISAILDHYFPKTDSETPLPMAGYQQRAGQFSGTYRPLQADVTTFAKSMYFFSQQVAVSATDEGYLSVSVAGMMGDRQSSTFGGFEGTSLWVEVEPLYFERVDGKGRLAFVQNESGDIIRMISGQGYHSPFVKLPWYESTRFQIILIELVVVLVVSMLLFILIIWPLGSFIQKRRRQPVQMPISWPAVVARLWAGIVGGMLVLFVFRAIGVLYAIDAVGGLPNFVWGISDEMVSVLNSIYLPVLLALPLPIFAGLAWGNRWWKLSAQVHYTLVVLAILGGIWWTHYWNLLGFRI